MSTPIFIGQADDEPVYLLSNMANRHGLVAGATGTGKTVTLQGLAEGFSDIGVDQRGQTRLIQYQRLKVFTPSIF